METLNFIFNHNRFQVDEHLKSFGYSKIGNEIANAKGYCILINRKQYFEIETVTNPNIKHSSNISDVIQYCL